jgi:hypothetical protein
MSLRSLRNLINGQRVVKYGRDEKRSIDVSQCSIDNRHDQGNNEDDEK